MNDGDISMTTMNGSEQVSEDYKKFLYTRATHSNHVIQYHMQQIMERHKVVDEHRSMMMEGMSLIPLESNSYKSHLVVISHTIQMIEVDNFWQKVVDEYRSMMMKGMSLIPLESNSYKSHLVVISHTIQMIELDNFWHLKTFGAF